MEDQYFMASHTSSMFDMSGCGSAPVGFSPSIDGSGDLPFSFGTGHGHGTSSSFLIEIQRRRADTVTTLKPDSEDLKPLEVDEDGIEIDIPIRKRGRQRLSLASSITSSAASSGTSDLEGVDWATFEYDSDSRSSASPEDELSGTNASTWDLNTTQSFSDFSGAFASTDRIPDLVHWRSNMTIQATFYQRDLPSPSAFSRASETLDTLSQTTDLNFEEFIDENPRPPVQADDGGWLETVENTRAMTIGGDVTVNGPVVSTTNAIGSIDNSRALSSVSEPVLGNAIKHEPELSLRGQAPFVDSHSSAMPSLEPIDSLHHGNEASCCEPAFQTCTLLGMPQGQPGPQQHPAPMPHPYWPSYPAHEGPLDAHNAYPSTLSAAKGDWSLPRAVSTNEVATNPSVYPGQPMTFSQSAPVHVAPPMPMFNGAMMPSPVPSSPAYSAASGSPYCTPTRPLLSGSQSYTFAAMSPGPSRLQFVPSGAGPNYPGSPSRAKRRDTQDTFADLVNPYANMITKRSRGRHVPSVPDEVMSLGKCGKRYVCRVPGCGKFFQRGEHLKRHVKSIHTNERPFVCPFPTCLKTFSRHDNLNQHARVHGSAFEETVRRNFVRKGEAHQDGSKP